MKVITNTLLGVTKSGKFGLPKEKMISAPTQSQHPQVPCRIHRQSLYMTKHKLSPKVNWVNRFNLHPEYHILNSVIIEEAKVFPPAKDSPESQSSGDWHQAQDEIQRNYELLQRRLSDEFNR